MKIKFYQAALFLISITVLQACTSLKPFYDKTQLNWQTANSPDSLKLKYSVWLFGDGGVPDKDVQEPVLKLLQSQVFHHDTSQAYNSPDTAAVNNSHPEDVVIFLGDNIYE